MADASGMYDSGALDLLDGTQPWTGAADKLVAFLMLSSYNCDVGHSTQNDLAHPANITTGPAEHPALAVTQSAPATSGSSVVLGAADLTFAGIQTGQTVDSVAFCENPGGTSDPLLCYNRLADDLVTTGEDVSVVIPATGIIQVTYTDADSTPS